MFKTENAKITLIMSKYPLVVLFMEYPNSSRHKKNIVMAFDLTKPNDICQLQQLSNITGTRYGNFLDLDQKHLRLIVEEDAKFAVKAIGSYKRDIFFTTDGNGTLMDEASIYNTLGKS